MPEVGKAIKVFKAKTLNDMDMHDLCDATVDTMNETSGFNVGSQQIISEERSRIQSYWEGVLMVPERILFLGRFEGIVAGSIQLLTPSPSNQISPFAASIDNFFVAPWARGNGLSELLLQEAEKEAAMLGISVLKISVRQTRKAAIKVIEKRNYTQWGLLPKYELDKGEIVPGLFYYKEI